MSKKSFKNNPALQFITDSGAQNELQEENMQEFINKKRMEGYKLNPMYVETKSRRLQLILQPSLYERVKLKAKSKKLSVNEFVHQILDQATRDGKE